MVKVETMSVVGEKKNMKNTSLKVCLLGDGGVGKTTWVTRHLTGEFKTKYVPTIGVEVHPIPYYTNNGMVTLNMWDTAGQEKFGGLRDAYYICAHAFIVFFDVTSKLSFKNTAKWIADAKKANPKALIVLVGNKVDCKARDMKVVPGSFIPPKDIPFFDISSKNNYNFEKPILAIVRHMLGEDTHFVECPVIEPPTIRVNDVPKEKSEQDYNLELASEMAELFSRFTSKEHFSMATMLLEDVEFAIFSPKVTDRSNVRKAKMNKK